MYIDETGSQGISKHPSPANRLLCLMGCIVSRRHYVDKFFPCLSAIKAEFFGERTGNPVVLHRFEIDQRSGHFAVLNDKTVRDRFNRAMAQFYRDHDYALISVAIDKHAHSQRYGKNAWHPYHYCARLLFERYCLFLRKRGVKGDAVAESRNECDNKALEAEWLSQFKGGTKYIGSHVTTSVLMDGQLNFRTKADNVAGLQLADMLLQPALEEMRVERGERKMIKNYGDVHICSAIRGKWDCAGDGKIWGYGKVWVP